MARTAGASDGNYRDYPDDAAFDNNRITVATWIRPNETSASSSAISRWQQDANHQQWILGVRLNPGARFRFLIQDSGGTNRTAVAASDFSTGTWYLVIGVYYGSNVILYWGTGAPLTKVTGDAMTGDLAAITSSIRLFERQSTFKGHFDCDLAHVAAWDIAFTDAHADELAESSPEMVEPQALYLHDWMFAANNRILGSASDTGTVSAVDHPRINIPKTSHGFIPPKTVSTTRRVFVIG